MPKEPGRKLKPGVQRPPKSPGRPVGSRNGPGANMTGAKWDADTRAVIASQVAKFSRQGHSQSRVAELMREHHGVEISQPTVSLLLKDVRAGYVVLAVEERRAKVAEFQAMYRDIRAEAWEMWYLSKTEFVRKTKEVLDNNSGEGGYTKFTETKEGRLAAAEYMRIILQTIAEEREMMGLDAPKETKMSGTLATVNVNFDDLVKAAESRPLPSVYVEEEIRKAGGLPALNPKED